MVNGKKMDKIFNRDQLRNNFDRYAQKMHKNNFFAKYSAELLQEKLSATNLTFNKVLNLGARSDSFYDFLRERNPNVEILETNISAKFLAYSTHYHKLCCDEENLQLAENSFDLVISCQTLHLVNDLVGSFIQIRKILTDKGLFIANFPAEGSLSSLREACINADAVMGSASPKISPFITIKSLGNLLQRAGFFMPITDIDHLIIEYSNLKAALYDLKYMGEGNILYKKTKNFMSKKRLKLIEDNYNMQYKDADMINIEFFIANLTAFKN
jgi:NADH dehydrogenase [ubiquinone] 1 alpha subcomplex assembly factor 5